MMHALLFVAYAAVLSYFLSRSPFLKNSGLTVPAIIALFVLSVLLGCAHLLIAFRFFPNHGDIWQVFDYSVQLRHLLLTDYRAFHKEFLPDEFSVDLAGTHLGWSYYQLQGLAVLHLAFNFLSLDNIYINTLLFNFLLLFGKVAFYRLLHRRYPRHGPASFLLAFVLPSVLFWTSVIYKEGVLFGCLGALLYCVQSLLDGKKKAAASLAGALMLLLVFVTRKALLMVLLPALAGWWLSERTRLRPVLAVLVAWSAWIGLLAMMGNAHAAWSIGHAISDRQHEYTLLEGGSRVFAPAVDGSAGSLIHALPWALRNGLFVPIPGTGLNRLYILFFAETLLIWALIVWNTYRNRLRFDGFTISFLVMVLVTCLFIGYTVPFAGALVRYRSILYPFLLASFIFSSKSNEIKKIKM